MSTPLSRLFPFHQEKEMLSHVCNGGSDKVDGEVKQVQGGGLEKGVLTGDFCSLK